MKFIISSLIFIFHLNVLALVDMRTANYTFTWTDVEAPGVGYDFKVIRTYNSRSLFNGIFGFGWCSNFETTLEPTPEGNLKIRECGSGQTIVFSPKEVGKKEVDATIDQIINKMRAEKKVGMSEDFVKQLRKDLFDIPSKRYEMAKQYDVKTPVKEGTRFNANGSEVEHIIMTKDFYTRNFGDGSSQRFSLGGKLLALHDKNNNFLKFKYDKDSLREIEDNTGRKMFFKFYANKKVKEIVSPGGIKAEYKFTNIDDLAWVKNGWQNIYTYTYDDLHNLTKATWPDKTFVVIKYNKKQDWVIGFTDRSKCDETYTYEFSKTEPDHHYWASVKKVCGKETVANNRYEFWHKQKPDGQFFLSRILTSVGGNTTDILYDDNFGKPLSIRRNSEKLVFDYYPNGQVKTKLTNNAKLVFEYNREVQKISNVTMTILNQKGEKVATKVTTFKYDGKGNLIFANNTDGQSVNMTYDGKGRIATILDQAKKIVRIEYEERFGKPHIVTRPGLGTIKVSYKSNGEIDKVDSKEGPSVALQVASTFNNLLDVIAPATQEVYL